MAVKKQPKKPTIEQKLRKQIKQLTAALETENRNSEFYRTELRAAGSKIEVLEKNKETFDRNVNMAQQAKIASLSREVDRLTEFIRWQINPDTAELSEQNKLNIDNGMMQPLPGGLY